MGSRRSFAVCKCFYEKNFYVKEWKAHVSYKSEGDFRKTHHDKPDVEEVLRKIKAELDRRYRVKNDQERRTETTKKMYKQPLHPHLYRFDDGFLDSRLKQVIRNPGKAGEVGPGVFSFPFFTEKFCRQLVAELKHFLSKDIPYETPNSMNRYGLSLDELGFGGFFDHLRVNFLQELSRKLFPDLPYIVLDSHKVFVVKYKIGEDVDLGTHFDNSEVTVNVSLSADHEGGEIVFNDYTGEGFVVNEFGHEHKVGQGIAHLGSHFHRALPIESGERWNVIMWMRSSEIRNKRCPMCSQLPRLVEAPGYGDGFTMDC